MKKEGLIFIMAMLPVWISSQITRNNDFEHHHPGREKYAITDMHHDVMQVHGQHSMESKATDGRSGVWYFPDSIYQYRFNALADSFFSNKCYFEYDEKGKMTLSTSFAWDTTLNQWIGVCIELVYDIRENLTVYCVYEWNHAANHWIKKHKWKYSYNEKGNMTSKSEYDWNINENQWIGCYKTEYAYNSEGIETSDIVYRWDQHKYQWSEGSKTEYTCDTHGNITLGMNYCFDEHANQWISCAKTECVFDKDNRETLCIGYCRDTTTNQWMKKICHEYRYDTTLNKTTDICYGWDEERNIWGESFRSEYTIDAYGHEIQWDFYQWEHDRNQWIGYTRHKHIYAASGIETLYVEYVWDPTGSYWIEYFKEESTHDVDENTILSLVFERDIGSAQWNLIYKTHYFRIPPEVNAIPKTGQSGFLTIYPNPAAGILNIKRMDNQPCIVSIYDATGQLIKTEVLEQCITTISTDLFGKGIYFFQIRTPVQSDTQKVLIR